MNSNLMIPMVGLIKSIREVTFDTLMYEVVIEKEIHGRKWKFCNMDCLENFNDALDFRDDADDDDDADKPAGG